MAEIDAKDMSDVCDDYPLTKKQLEELLGKKENEVDTDQEDVPLDVLKNFPDFKLPRGCPRCNQNGSREQLVFPNEPLRFRCSSCGGVSLSTDWT